jgi:REP element-mobilizing transposase RayT
LYFHIWFVTKYRRAILEGDIERNVKDYFLEISKNKNYNILELEANRDHVHMVVAEFFSEFDLKPVA